MKGKKSKKGSLPEFEDDFDVVKGEIVNEDLYDEDGLLREDPEFFDKSKLLTSVNKIFDIKKKGRGIVRREAVKDAEAMGAIKRKAGPQSSLHKLLETVKETGEEKAVDKVSKLVKATTLKPVKTLETPLEKPQALKAKRSALYDNAKEEVSRFNAIVYHNRASEQLVFPQTEGKKAEKISPNERVANFIPMTPLEEEMARILYGEDYLKRKKAELQKPKGPSDEDAYSLSVEEALHHHSEMARLRAKQSYEMAKSRRQNKIKSKKYHRLIRKENIRKQLKEFEELQKEDPNAALVKLEELNQSRINERMSLKHRNTSKWAKMHSARAKYNKDSRMALSEQLEISKHLSQKVEESSDEEDPDLEFPTLVKSSVENPWLLNPDMKDNVKLQLYYPGYKRLWEDINNAKQKKEKKQEKGKKKSKKMKAGDADEIRDLELDPAQQIIEGGNAEIQVTNPFEREEEKPKKAPSVDPSNYLKIKKKSNKKAKFDGESLEKLDFSAFDEDVDDDDSGDDDQRKLIAEAFEDDDVVDEFRKRKNDDIEASKPQDIDLNLPGWGEWAGKGIKPNEKKRKRFIIKAPPPKPRKDDGLSHVILNEESGEGMKAHQVSQLPFPFSRVKDFEKTIRAPVGRTFLPEKAMKDLTAPKVITRLGTVIEPLSEDVLVKEKSKDLKVPQSIVRLARVKKVK